MKCGNGNLDANGICCATDKPCIGKWCCVYGDMRMVIPLPSLSKARELAAQAWCRESTKHLDMIPELAEEFAIVIQKVQQNPDLKIVSNNDLLSEVKRRMLLR